MKIILKKDLYLSKLDVTFPKDVVLETVTYNHIVNIIHPTEEGIITPLKKHSHTEYEPKYILSEDGIMVVGSHGVTLNSKIRDEEMHEFYIEEKSEIVDNLIMWISECSRERAGDKALMQDDLKMLMDRDETYFFSSNSTNSYVFPDDSNFNETCEELIELNETLN